MSTSWAYEAGQWFRCDRHRRPLDGERFDELPPINYGDTLGEADVMRLMDQQALAASDQAERDLPLAERTERARRALSGAQNAQDVQARAAQVRRDMQAS